MKIDLDGNALCIKPDNFINLQISPAFFVDLTENQIKLWKDFENKILKDSIMHVIIKSRDKSIELCRCSISMANSVACTCMPGDETEDKYISLSNLKKILEAEK